MRPIDAEKLRFEELKRRWMSRKKKKRNDFDMSCANKTTYALLSLRKSREGTHPVDYNADQMLL